MRSFSKRTEVLDPRAEEALRDPARASQHLYGWARLLEQDFLLDPFEAWKDRTERSSEGPFALGANAAGELRLLVLAQPPQRQKEVAIGWIQPSAESSTREPWRLLVVAGDEPVDMPRSMRCGNGQQTGAVRLILVIQDSAVLVKQGLLLAEQRLLCRGPPHLSEVVEDGRALQKGEWNASGQHHRIHARRGALYEILDSTVYRHRRGYTARAVPPIQDSETS
jgi:hypothetical protein